MLVKPDPIPFGDKMCTTISLFKGENIVIGFDGILSIIFGGAL
jgi:hypothetical protein